MRPSMFNFRSKKDTLTPSVNINISNRTVVRVVALVILSLIGFAALKQAQHALIIIFTAFFLSLALNGPVHWLALRLPGKRKGSRAAATAISFLLIILVLGGFLASIVPPLVRQTSNFISAAPGLVEQARDQNGTFGRFVAKYNLEGQVDKIS